MKKNKKIIISLISIISILCSVFIIPANAQNKSMLISYPELTDDEINSSYLEEKGENKITFAEEGKTDFSIFYPDSCSEDLSRSVRELISVVKEMSGAEIPINTDGRKPIYIDKMSDKNTDKILYDGFVIDISDKCIHIKGNTEKATANGIYSFIEYYLGAVFVSPDDTFIPEHKNIYLEKGNKIFNPAMEWRDVYSYEAGSNSWSAKLRLNSLDTESTDDEILSSISSEDLVELSEYDKEKKIIETRQYDGWMTWCHSLYTYLSPEEYFESNPEYFSLKSGKRVHTYKGRDAHLCLSNPEVYNIVEKNMEEMMEENPDKQYWDFSCNDNNLVAGCECSDCKKADKDAGGTGMGTLLPFINKLARRFPDKYISTLAYLHTLKAPENSLKAEKNVVIKLCAMPGDQASSYLNPSNKNAEDFSNQVKEWSKITDKIIVWDYVVNFANLLIPFPNFAVQQENQKFYEDNNVSGIFHQASREKGGELTELRTYVLSKLMWEGSSMDVAHEVSKFTYAFYGNAAPEVIKYFNLLASYAAQTKTDTGMYEDPFSNREGYLSDKCIKEYSDIIKNAEENVKEDKTRLDRVRKIEMSLTYAKLFLPGLSETERTEETEKLRNLTSEFDIKMLREWESTEDFIKNLPDLTASYKNTLRRPYYIAGGVCAGLIVLIPIIIFIIKKIKHNKKKA